jgi:hypothetical protein
MTAAAILPADDKDSVRRWMFAASVVVLLHGAIVLWLMHVRETSSTGAPPAAGSRMDGAMWRAAT